MRIDQTVEVPAPITKVWDFLGDIPSVATCMPGATLTKTVDDSTYEGLVKIGIGPLTMNYTGTVTIEERDETEHTVRLLAAGRDRRGSGTAKAHITAHLLPNGDGTKLRVDSDVNLTGRVAALGRGVNDVATTLFAEFADRLTAELSGTPAAAAKTTEAAKTTDAARPAPALTPPRTDDAGIKLGALVWSVTRQRLGAFLIRLGEKVRP
jgi:carbon monoxide dehydrogenase subunit G